MPPAPLSSALAAIPVLGVGLAYRSALRAALFQHRGALGFLEVTADHFFPEHTGAAADRQALSELSLLRDHFTLAVHGLNLSLGSAEGIDLDYLEQLALVVEAANAPYWSEHIALTRAGGVEIGHLAPVEFSPESLLVLERNILIAQQRIPRPLILENITYSWRWPFSTLDEASFLGELLDRCECGLLLDVTNLYTNSVNHRFDPLRFLERLPPERIVQLHFAGGHWNGTELIDSHSHPVSSEVWQLLEETLKFAPVKGVILERDDNLSAIAELMAEVERACTVGRKFRRW